LVFLCNKRRCSLYKNWKLDEHSRPNDDSRGKDKYPTIIGNYVSIGHRAIIHGCRINDYVLIGMGAIILNNAFIDSWTIVAAGSVVREDFKGEKGVLIAGVPAVVKRKLTDEEIKLIEDIPQRYVRYSRDYINEGIR
jgi:gamma-carbonic anhydrase